jgi:hypothetical protein
MAVRAGTAGWGGTRLGRVIGACLVLGGALACLGRPSDGAAIAFLSARWPEPLQEPVHEPSEERPAPDAPAGPARVALGPHGRDIRLAGELGEGTAERLRRLLAANPQVERLHLTSEGGLVEEGQAIGDLVAARGLATYVPDYCVSACTLAFVRGTRRFLVEGGRLGFHAPYEVGPSGRVVQVDGVPERAAYLAAGLDPAFVTQALATASDDLWVPDAHRLVAARAVTETVDTGQLPDSTLDDDPSPAGARAAVLRILPILETSAVAGSAPPIEDLAAWYAQAYRSGRSEAENVEGLRRRAAMEIARTLSRADDATALAAGRVLLRAMLTVRDSDRALCGRIGAGADLVEASEALGDAATALAARAGSFSVGELTPGPVHGRGCQAEIHAYARALAKPSAEAALSVRALVQRAAPPVHAASALP